MTEQSKNRVAIESHSPELSANEADVDLWLSCHGYESRSISHLKVDDRLKPARKLSFGFDFPDLSSDDEVASRIALARDQLLAAGYMIPVVNDEAFERAVHVEVLKARKARRSRIVADISSMSRSRIAALLLACCTTEWHDGCDLDVVYYPGSHASHKHPYEPLEYFGPSHADLSGWPEDPDSPLALIIGLGTEPRRADGVVELLEPDILAPFIPTGPESAYLEEVQTENRRVLEVGGEAVVYDLVNPANAYRALLAAATGLAARSRLVILPLGPKAFFAVSVIAALTIGPQVGVWKASAGRGVRSVDVKAIGDPIVMRLRIDK